MISKLPTNSCLTNSSKEKKKPVPAAYVSNSVTITCQLMTIKLTLIITGQRAYSLHACMHENCSKTVNYAQKMQGCHKEQKCTVKCQGNPRKICTLMQASYVAVRSMHPVCDQDTCKGNLHPYRGWWLKWSFWTLNVVIWVSDTTAMCTGRNVQLGNVYPYLVLSITYVHVHMALIV